MNRVKAIARPLLTVLLLTSSDAADTWVVRNDGVGPVKVGMTLAQLNVALHENFMPPTDKADRGCFYVTPAKHAQISLMIENGHLVRVDVDHPGIATSEGVQVGDSEPRALQIYGSSLTVERRAYMEEEGHFLTLRSRDGRLGIRFETDQGKITGYYAGKYDAIQYIEGCE